jgi:hypothetical protein
MANIGRVKMYHGNQGAGDDEAGFSLLFFDENGDLVIRNEDPVEIYVGADWHGSVSRIKILPRDFISSDVANPEYMKGASNQVITAGAAAELIAAVPIPTGYKATHVRVYATAARNVAVYEADINTSIITAKGNGDTTAEIDITDVASDDTNFLRIEAQAVNGAGIYGGYVTIAKI